MIWNQAVRRAMKRHVARAQGRLDPTRFAQEPAYVAALLARLDGVVYEGKAGRVEFFSTIVADRGPNSAESRFGADFAIAAHLSQPGSEVRKAVLGQAKKGALDQLRTEERQRFQLQVHRMAAVTSAIVGLEVPRATGDQLIVRVVDVVSVPTDTAEVNLGLMRIGPPRDLADYLTRGIMRCSHGDARDDFVGAVSSSDLSRLQIVATSLRSATG